MYRRSPRVLPCLAGLLLMLVLLLPPTLSSRAAQFGPLLPHGIPKLQAIDSDFVRLQIGGTAGLPSHVDMPFLMPSGLAGQQLLAASVALVAKRLNGTPSFHLANPADGAILTRVSGSWDNLFITRYFESWWAQDEALGNYMSAVLVPGTQAAIRGRMTAPPSGISTFDIDQVRLLLYAANVTPPLPLGACRPANIHLVVDNSAALGAGNVTALRTALGGLMDGVEAILPDTNWRLTTYRTSSLSSSAPIVSSTSWQATPPTTSLATMTSSGLSPLANALTAAVSGGRGPDADGRDAILIIVSAGPPNARLGGNAGTDYERMYGAAGADAVEAANAARTAGWSTIVATVGSGHADLSSRFVASVNRGLAGIDVMGPAGEIVISNPSTVGEALSGLLLTTCGASIAIEATGPDVVLAGQAVNYDYRVTNTGHVPLSSVSVSSADCGAAAYLTGDANGDAALGLDETWHLACNYTPSFAPAAPLTHVAVASGRHGQAEVTARASHTLYPLSLAKDVYLYWSDGNPVPYDRTDVSFEVEVRKGAQVLRTVRVTDTDAAATHLWLGEGSYALCEANLPTGYIAAGGCLSFPDEGKRVTDWVFPNAIRYDLAIQKSGPTCAAPGQTVTFTYTVTNAGPASVTPAVSDTFGAEVVTPTYQAGDANGNGKVDPGEMWLYRLEYVIPDDAEGILVNAVTVADADLPAGQWLAGGDAHEGNNVAAWGARVVRPAIAIAVTPASQQVLVGDTASFTIMVTNTGDTRLSNVAVTDPLAPDCARATAALAPGEGWQFTCSLGNVLAPLTNVATVSAASCAGPVGAQASAAVTTALRPLVLSSECWQDDDAHRWRVTNPNPIDVSYTWVIDGAAIGGSGTAAAITDTWFTTVGVEYGERVMARLFVDGAATLADASVVDDSALANGDWCSPRGAIVVDTAVDWNGVPADAGQTFTITITGPSYPGGDSQSVGHNGGAASWSGLAPGVYTVTEAYPGDQWIVSGSGVTVTVPANGGSVSMTITNARKLGTLEVVKIVDWNGVTPDPGQTFQICIQGPSYPDGDCQTVSATTGWTASWTDLIPGEYTVTEPDPGSEGTVSGSTAERPPMPWPTPARSGWPSA